MVPATWTDADLIALVVVAGLVIIYNIQFILRIYAVVSVVHQQGTSCHAFFVIILFTVLCWFKKLWAQKVLSCWKFGRFIFEMIYLNVLWYPMYITIDQYLQ